jgi:hypothetical protein
MQAAAVVGRHRFVEDVLLHEMIHQFHQEVTGQHEHSYHGHGPAFRDKANEIGAALGLSRVRDSKRRGAEKHLPSCAQWPHCVRPNGYYLGVHFRSTNRTNWRAVVRDLVSVALANLDLGNVADARKTLAALLETVSSRGDVGDQAVGDMSTAEDGRS